MGLEAQKVAPVQTIGNYEILAKIAEGGMGTVYKGRHRDTGDIVAIKIVPPTTARNPTLLKRFEREFTTARALDHPNVVKAIEFNGSGVAPFLVMEYVDGETLGQRIEREGPIPEDEAIRLISQVAHGLYRAHKQGLIHRDVKPDNILVTADGQAKLTDLGLVKDSGDDFNLTRTGRGLGTPHFMAPEQFRDAKNADVRCDIYSLGATLYMMVTGHMPFSGCSPLDCFMKKLRHDLTPPRDVMPSLSERVDWAIRRAMGGNADHRPVSCREFVEDLYGRSTRTQPAGGADSETDLWYLVYQDELGESHTVKGATEGIRRALKDGLLGDASNIVACRQKQGPFLTLRSFPEFRDLVVEPEPLPAPNLNPRSTPTQVHTAPSGRWPEPPSSPPRSGRHAAPQSDPSAIAQPPLSSTRYPRDSAESSGRLPHIPMETARRGSYEIILWLMVLFIAVGTGLAAFYFFPSR